jgi:hypothetical protein
MLPPSFGFGDSHKKILNITSLVLFKWLGNQHYQVRFSTGFLFLFLIFMTNIIMVAHPVA